MAVSFKEGGGCVTCPGRRSSAPTTHIIIVSVWGESRIVAAAACRGHGGWEQKLCYLNGQSINRSSKRKEKEEGDCRRLGLWAQANNEKEKDG